MKEFHTAQSTEKCTALINKGIPLTHYILQVHTEVLCPVLLGGKHTPYSPFMLISCLGKQKINFITSMKPHITAPLFSTSIAQVDFPFIPPTSVHFITLMRVEDITVVLLKTQFLCHVMSTGIYLPTF